MITTSVPLYTAQQFLDNRGLCLQCGMMLDGFPTAVTEKIEAAREDVGAIKRIIDAESARMIDSFFKTDQKSREQKVLEISEFIHAFFAYRKTVRR